MNSFDAAEKVYRDLIAAYPDHHDQDTRRTRARRLPLRAGDFG